MNKSNVYVFFSYESESDDFEVLFSTTAADKMLKILIDEYNLEDDFYLEFKEDLTIESLERKCSYPTRIWDEDMYEWLVLQSIEVDVPQNREMYAIFANGSEVYSWEGAMEGLYATKELAIEAIIKAATEDDDEAEEAMTDLTQHNFYVDPYMTHWIIIPISIS